MCTDGTPGPPYLAEWSCTVQAATAPDAAVARTAAWARATMDNWGLGGLAGDVVLIVAEFSSNADFRAATSAPLCLDWVLLLPGVLPGLRSFFRGRYPCRTWPG